MGDVVVQNKRSTGDISEAFSVNTLYTDSVAQWLGFGLWIRALANVTVRHDV